MSHRTNDPHAAKPTPPPRNGIDVPGLRQTVATFIEQPVLSEFRFRATNRWIKGAHSRTSLGDYTGAGSEHPQARDFAFEADMPPSLSGTGEAPTPLEFLLHALISCLATSMVSLATTREINLTEVETTVEGDINLAGALGLEGADRPGYRVLRVELKVRGDAEADVLAELARDCPSRSAVFDTLTRSTPIHLRIDAR